MSPALIRRAVVDEIGHFLYTNDILVIHGAGVTPLKRGVDKT